MPNEISIEDEVFGTRLLVFIEHKAQSNQYHQILLNEDEFKKMSMSIGKVIKKDGDNEEIEIELSKELYTLPDLMEIHAK